MKLQTGTLLALYSVLEFAANPERQVSTAEIAEKYGASAHHLSKVLADLARAGLLDSVRGVGGGYRFSGNAKRVTMMDVIELFEDISARAVNDSAPGGPIEAEHALAAVLSEIDETAKATFRSITVDTMLKLMERQRTPAVT
jgi:Rrf2 family protein